MTTTLIHCAAATTNTTNSTKMMTGSKGLLASKDSRTRIKVVKVASYYGGRLVFDAMRVKTLPMVAKEAKTVRARKN